MDPMDLSSATIREVLSSDHYANASETINFFALSNVSPQLIERTIRFLQNRWVSVDGHLKRIRGDMILVTPVSEVSVSISTTTDRVEDNSEFCDQLLTSLGHAGLLTEDLRVVQVPVPARPVLTKYQYKVANAIWPIRVTTPLVDESELLVGLERDCVLKCFQKLLTITHNRCACMFVPPGGTSDEGIIGYASDRESRFHYKHAVFDAAGQVGKQSEYLATDYSVYCLGEPCIMCAMALLHSRVCNVYYLVSASPDTAWGGLGSILSIHCNKQLNHRFRVFRVHVSTGLQRSGAPSV
jgi:hypothetical protein